MPAHSQAEMERQFRQRQALVQTGQIAARQAFGIVEDWTLHLGKRKALLHPGTGVWLWYDRLHNYWHQACCGVNEGILVTLGNAAGMKKLPQPGPVAAWCLYRQATALHGPVRFEQLRQALQTGQTSLTVKIWTPRAADWLSAAQFLALPTNLGLAASGFAAPFLLTQSITIGRAEDCDLHLKDSKVSRKHARIEARQDGYWISDLGSGNGVLLNNQRIQASSRLAVGDQICIGDSLIEVVLL